MTNVENIMSLATQLTQNIHDLNLNVSKEFNLRIFLMTINHGKKDLELAS